MVEVEHIPLLSGITVIPGWRDPKHRKKRSLLFTSSSLCFSGTYRHYSYEDIESFGVFTNPSRFCFIIDRNGQRVLYTHYGYGDRCYDEFVARTTFLAFDNLNIHRRN